MDYNFRTDPLAYYKVSEENPVIIGKANYIRICPCCKKMTKENLIMKSWMGYCIACANGKHIDSCCSSS